MRRRVYHEPWIECSICGFEIPRSHAVRHYKTRKLVDAKCADQMDPADLRALVRTPMEGGDVSPQPVSDQGQDGYSSGFGVGPFGETPFGSPSE